MNNRVGFQARLQQHGRAILGGALAATLAACGGSSGGTSQTPVNNSFIDADLVLGHTDYTTYKPNQAVTNGTVGVTAATVSNPTGSIATNGTLFYVADTNNHRILGWKSIPTKAGQAADFVLGQVDFSHATPGASQTRLDYPGKVSISDDGRLVVADTGNNRVLVWNSLPQTTNAPADVVIGQTSFTASQPNQDSAVPSAQSLSNPTAAMIEKGRLFIIDNNNNRMLIWDLTSHPLPTTAGTAYDTDADLVWGQPSANTNVPNCGQGTASANAPGTFDCSLGNYPISQYSLNQPQDLWTDGTKLFVADSSNNRVLFWSQIPIANSSFATFVMGQGTFSTGSTGGASQTAMSAPYSVSSDGSSVFVADTNNNRVLVFDNFPALSGPSATTVLGQNYWNYNTANDDDQNQQVDNNPTARTLNRPTAVFALGGSAERVFVTDFGNNRVLEFKPQ